LQKALQDFGGVLAFDSARDNNSRSLMPVMLCGSNQKLLVAIPRPDGPKHAGWIARVLGTILDCTYDVGAQELASSSTGRALSAGNAASILNEIANFVGPYVWMVCSDHASPEIKAMKNLQVSHAVLACGDPSHAAHNLAKYLITPFQGFIDLVNDVANFFRNHGEAKTWLQTKLKEQEGGKANAFTIMQNNVETRFLSVFYMLQSFLRALPALKDVVNVSAWVTWTTKTFKGDRLEDCEKIAETIKDPKSGPLAEFLCAVLLPLLKMCRFFDAARVGSLSFVYLFWSMLDESVLAAIANPKFKEFVTPKVVKEIKSTLMYCWDRFDFDVYGAAFMLNPYFHERVRAIQNPQPSSHVLLEALDVQSAKFTAASSKEFYDLKKQTLRVLQTMVRRFEPVPGARARVQILSEGDAEVLDTMAVIKAELNAYLSTPSRGRRWAPQGTSKRAIEYELPGIIWGVGADEPSTLGLYASKIVTGVVGSTDVERMHWRNGRTRTSSRNRLGYVRSHSLVFLDHYLHSKPVIPSQDWNASMAILHEFDQVSAQDEEFLQDLEKRIAEAEKDATAKQNAAADVGANQADDDIDDDADDADELGGFVGVGMDGENENTEGAGDDDGAIIGSSTTTGNDGVVPDAGTKRRASSRFYSLLAIEVESNSKNKSKWGNAKED
jgi:hypothetical protein